MRWTTNHLQASYMRHRRQQNIELSLRNQNENTAFSIIKKHSNLKWERQKAWGCRLFDFWCGHMGVAIELDGPEHDPEYDAVRDRHNELRSAIAVFRIKNGDWGRLIEAVQEIHAMPCWKERRSIAGLNVRGPGSKKLRRSRLVRAGIPPAHGNWLPPMTKPTGVSARHFR